MLKPEISQLLNETESPYSLVVAVAKRSRDLAELSESKKIDLDDKPVNVAISEFGAHKLKIVRRYAEK